MSSSYLVFNLVLFAHFSRIWCISSWKHSNIKLPIPMKSQQVAYNEPNVYLFRGSTNSSETISTLQWNISDTERWNALNDSAPAFVSNTQSVAVVLDMVYFVGNNTIFMFNMTTQKWIKNDDIPNMVHGQSDGCVAKNDSHIFVVGGVYDDVALNDKSYLQIYDIDNNEWLGPQQIPISSSWSNQMCNMVHRKTLYIFGGVLGNQNVSNIVLKYDVLAQNWTFIANMSTGIHNAWGVHDKNNGKIYLVGGARDDGTIENKIKIFDVKTETFLGDNIMMDYVENAAAVIASDQLIVFGGCTQGNKNDSGCKLLSTVQLSSLPLHATPARAYTVYWRIMVFVVSISAMILLCCWLEMKVLNKSDLVNKDNLVSSGDLHRYEKHLNS